LKKSYSAELDRCDVKGVLSIVSCKDYSSNFCFWELGFDGFGEFVDGGSGRGYVIDDEDGIRFSYFLGVYLESIFEI
jgi:hypothetical protein